MRMRKSPTACGQWWFPIQAIWINIATFVNYFICWCNCSLACKSGLLHTKTFDKVWVWIPWVFVCILGHNQPPPGFVTPFIYSSYTKCLACINAQCKVPITIYQSHQILPHSVTCQVQLGIPIVHCSQTRISFLPWQSQLPGQDLNVTASSATVAPRQSCTNNSLAHDNGTHNDGANHSGTSNYGPIHASSFIVRWTWQWVW